ncbi:MAG: nitrilase-related carbon-nitrogen hydrolase [Candidatus Helarchaeota archaeon]
MKVAAIQFEPLLNEKEKNQKKVLSLLNKSLKFKPKLIVLPELAFSGYNFNSKDDVISTSDEIPNSRSCKILKDFAEKNDLYIVSGINEKHEDVFYNSAVVFGPSGYELTYRKIHLYYNEKKFFNSGNLSPKLFAIDDVKVGIMICFDWFFPEFPRTLALMGADVICHPMNAVIPDGAMIGDTYHSRWNRVFIILANRIGAEGNLDFLGMSQISDPTGKVLVRASRNDEEIISFDLEINVARNKNLNPLNNVFQDRKPEFYFIK